MTQPLADADLSIDVMKGPKPIPVMTRLHRYFTMSSPTACWLWTGKKGNAGYGVIGVGSTRNGSAGHQYAHRVMWQETVSAIPLGQHVRHRCDTPACVNPSHLELGTQADNVRDMWVRGRGWARFTAHDVQEIRRRSCEGESQRSIARDLGTSHQLIGMIVRRQIWAHVP